MARILIGIRRPSLSFKRRRLDILAARGEGLEGSCMYLVYVPLSLLFLLP